MAIDGVKVRLLTEELFTWAGLWFTEREFKVPSLVIVEQVEDCWIAAGLNFGSRNVERREIGFVEYDMFSEDF